MQAKHIPCEPPKIYNDKSLSELVFLLIFQIRCQNRNKSM